MPPEPFVHQLPMRWADLDSLNHVNNVVYLDYAAEARALVGGGLLPPETEINRTTVRFLRPLLLSRDPVTVVSTLDGDMLAQAICVDREGSRTTFAEIVTTYGERVTVRPSRDATGLPVRIRRSDLDDDAGGVRPAQVLELFQESRILYVSQHLNTLSAGSFVIGSTDVEHRGDVAWRTEPYTMNVWVSRVGTASCEVRAELVDGDVVLAESTTTLVGFDPSTQRSRAFADKERRQLLAVTTS